MIDALNKENFNDNVPLNSIEEDEENVANKKKKLLRDLGEYIVTILKYYKKKYSETSNKELKTLYAKYISWYKIFLFIQQMNLLYNDLPLTYGDKEYGRDLPEEFKLIYEEVTVHKYENLERNIIPERNNIVFNSDEFITLWSKGFEIENREIIEKRKDTNNFYYNNDTLVFFMKAMEVEFKEDIPEEGEEIGDEEEERGRSKTKKSRKKSSSGSKSKSNSRSKSKSRSRSKSKSKSRSRSQSRNRSSSRGRNEKSKERKSTKTRKSKRADLLKNRETLPSEKKMNDISSTILKIVRFWSLDRNRLFVLLKSLPNLTNVNMDYRTDIKSHATLSSYGYHLLSVIYICIELISLPEGAAVSNERIDSLKDNNRLAICVNFEYLDNAAVVKNIIDKGIPIKHVIYLWQVLFQLMEWKFFLKLSQVIQHYFEVHDEEEESEEESNYRELFQCEWDIYVSISLYFSDLDKMEEKKEVKTDTLNTITKKMFEMTKVYSEESNKSTNATKSIIENAFDIYLYDKLNGESAEEIEKITNYLKYGVYALFKYLQYCTKHQMGCIFNINLYLRIIWQYCLRLFPEKNNFKGISSRNSVVNVKLIMMCLTLYNKYYPTYINPILYCKIIQQYILIILNNNYDYNYSEFINSINDVIKRVDYCLYSSRGTSHKYHSLSYNPSIFGEQFEFMTRKASKSLKKKEIIHSLIHKKYVLYGLMFRIVIIQKQKEYNEEREKKENEYLLLCKKKLTSYPEFMTKPTPEILETYCGKNNYLKSIFNLQFAIEMKNLSREQKTNILQDALQFLKMTYNEESMLIRHAYLNSENMNNHIDKNICPPPICVKRNNHFLIFKPLPPQNTKIKPYYYKIFCRLNNIGNVTMSDCSYQGTDEFIINKGEDTEIIISGLEENQKYIVAVAAYDRNKNLLCGRIGAQTTPILVAHPLPILINLSYLGQYVCTEELFNISKNYEEILFNYFIESICSENDLIIPFIKEPHWIKKVNIKEMNYFKNFIYNFILFL